MTPDEVQARAAELDAADPLAAYRDRFIGTRDDEAGVAAYLDGNSLGRPLRATRERLDRLVTETWGGRLIRAWDEQWMELPLTLGDRVGEVCLGAAPGQTVVADSTTVLLYKLLRGMVALAGPGRPQVVLDTENFPTDRYVAQGVAAETGAELVWLEPDPDAGVTPEQVASVVGERTGVVLLSHVAYRSAWLADLPAITRVAHDAGAMVLWDTCHSSGVVPVDVDAHQVDVVVGCSYKFLNGGPGAPAHAYVARRLHERLGQPVPGWMGHAEPFVMGPSYAAGPGMRRYVSGTPPVVGMTVVADMVDLIAEAGGVEALREKAVGLGELVVDVADGLLARHGVRVASPRDPARRGAHVTLAHPRSRELCAELWRRDVIPDFREPDGIRLGLSPLSTSYAEVAQALRCVDDLLAGD